MVDDNGLAASPTMTFFSSRGGPTNEGRMAVNGMTVAAPFNGGGVSTYVLDSVNVDEVSVAVSGGMGESDIGGPVMNLVPRSGGNSFRGQAFFNNAGEWSKGDNLNDELRAVGLTETPGIINAYDASVSLRRPDQARSTVVLWQLPQARDGDAGPGGRRQCERLQRGTLGLGARQQRHGAPDPGTHDVHRAVHGAGFRRRIVSRSATSTRTAARGRR